MTYDMQMQHHLYERMRFEYGDFIDSLKTLPPEEIINRSYEKVFKEDIMMAVREADLSDDVIRALLRTRCPLDECYNAWLKRDDTYMSELRDTIEDCGKRIIEGQRIRREER